jgi:hypothetical protein
VEAFSSFINYNWRGFSIDLQKNVAAHCLAIAFCINHGQTLNVNIKSEAQQKKLKTVRGSYTDLDLSIPAKKGPEKSRDTLSLNSDFTLSR